ncbi:MAG: TetR/AcrR family transcriptional regulator [Deltaproteobacteria bacterium]|nr:TetR/AcrR family transcriptional regulator [Deltaproteobacteria bacterium]
MSPRSPQPPGPPPREDLTTRARIGLAAIELFAARGYAGTSMADIAVRVGISKPGLYNHYHSKEELLLELLQHSLDAWRDASRPALFADGSCQERLWNHLMAAVEFTTDHRHELAIVRLAASLIGGELGERVGQIVAAQKEDYLRVLNDFFAEGLSRGELREAPAVDLALAWRSFLDGLLTDLVFKTRAQSLGRERLRNIWKIVWRGLEGPTENRNPQ